MWACCLLTEPWKIPDKVTALPTPSTALQTPATGGEEWGWEDGGGGWLRGADSQEGLKEEGSFTTCS